MFKTSKAIKEAIKAIEFDGERYWVATLIPGNKIGYTTFKKAKEMAEFYALKKLGKLTGSMSSAWFFVL